MVMPTINPEGHWGRQEGSSCVLVANSLTWRPGTVGFVIGS